MQGTSGESCSSVVSEGKRERPSDSPRSTSVQRRLRRRLLACDLMLARCSSAQASLACGLPCADDSTRVLGERDSDEEMEFEVTGVLFEPPRNQQPAGSSAGASASSGDRDDRRCVAGAELQVLAVPAQVPIRFANNGSEALPAAVTLPTVGVQLTKRGTPARRLVQEGSGATALMRIAMEQLASRSSTRCAWPFAHQHRQMTSRSLRQGSRSDCIVVHPSSWGPGP